MTITTEGLAPPARLREKYETEREGRYHTNGVTVTMFIGDESRIELHSPRPYINGEGEPCTVAWILDVSSMYGGGATLHVEDVATLRRMHATIGLALADVDRSETPGRPA